MSTPSETSAARLPSRVGAAAPVAREVAEDLEAIFPHAPPARSAARLRLGRKRKDAAGGGERRTAAAGAMIAAVFVGVSAGALLARGHAPGKPASEARPAAARTASLAGPALPSPGPLAPGPLHAPKPPPVLQASAVPAPAEAKVRKASAPRGRATRAKAARTVACRSSGCTSLKAADARLRRAYASAARAGVSRAALADYRSEWSRLRHRAPRHPRTVAARYDDMASELNRMAGRRRVAHAKPRSPSPWRSLRTELAALWR